MNFSMHKWYLFVNYVRENARQGVHYQDLMDDREPRTVRRAGSEGSGLPVSVLWTPRKEYPG